VIDTSITLAVEPHAGHGTRLCGSFDLGRAAPQPEHFS
jgi:hypothetical protein